MNIKLYYMSGAGNLFTVIDNRDYGFKKYEFSDLAVKTCNLDFKTEGLLVLDESNDTDFSVLFYNPDGSSDMMCGNGGRCAIFFAAEMNIFQGKEKVKFEMSNEIYEGIFEHNSISLFLPPPRQFFINQSIIIDNEILNYSFSDVGSKHFIIHSKSLFNDGEVTTAAIKSISKKIRYNEKFMPDGVNVNIYNIIDGKIFLNTYEKGVEDITGACGTGAVSTALHLKYAKKFNNKITILPPSKIPLNVEIVENNNQISKLILSGHAEIIKSITIDV